MWMKAAIRSAIVLKVGVLVFVLAGCETGLSGGDDAGLSGGDGVGLSGADEAGRRNNLQAMETARLTINDHPFAVWLAQTSSEITLGLMRVEEKELAPTPDGADRGMLFIFASERPLGFWMHNTITPLDIAFLRADGTIVKTHTMVPLDTSIYPSVEPAMYALEVRAGRFAELGIYEGDRAVLPDGI
jgi:uncharacterized membrane protein (UPF0127 family)